MGRYIPNPHRERLDDPEYIFADGKVTSGLRVEEGKQKMVILDELNAAAPNILIRLHEVLDALERNTEVVLSEDASEAVSVSREQTKIVGLMNPPGKGYFAREPLDPAQLRRWNYQKEVSHLPEETFSHSIDVMFGVAAETDASSLVPQESYLTTRDQRLPQKQLREIPGIEEVLGKYKEFHKAAKELVQNRSVAADQPQKFTFDDRVEPRRVTEFVQQFYNGDINETFQKALSYYYSNKLESKQDKQKLDELIRHVGYVPQEATQRRGAEREAPDGAVDPATPDTRIPEITTPLSGEVLEQVTEAQRILGFENVVSPDKVREILGLKFDLEKVPAIPFSEEELKKAKELGQFLVYRHNTDDGGESLSMKRLEEILQPKFSKEDDGKVLYDTDWYKEENFFTREAMRPGWALTSREVIPDSTSRNYLEQTGELAKYLSTKVMPEISDPSLRVQYGEAMREYDEQRGAIEKLMDSDWKEAARLLEDLKLNKLFRQTPVEAMYDTVMYFENQPKSERDDARLLKGMYGWTDRRSSDGDLVSAGFFDADGLSVGDGYPGSSHSDFGVSFSRNR